MHNLMSGESFEYFLTVFISPSLHASLPSNYSVISRKYKTRFFSFQKDSLAYIEFPLATYKQNAKKKKRFAVKITDIKNFAGSVLVN